MRHNVYNEKKFVLLILWLHKGTRKNLHKANTRAERWPTSLSGAQTATDFPFGTFSWGQLAWQPAVLFPTLNVAMRWDLQ
jgi:hypothetical protein